MAGILADIIVAKLHEIGDKGSVGYAPRRY